MSNDPIPEKELTFQYESTGDRSNFPKVADGSEVKLFATEIKEMVQKEPNFTPIPKGPKQHFRGPKTLVTDTLKITHTFQITAYVYNSDNKRKYSLDSSIRDSNQDGQISTQTITADRFDEYVLLGDTRIKYDSETITTDTSGNSLTRGTDYEINYDSGKIKFLDTGKINSVTEDNFFGGSTTVIDEDFKISYTFKGSNSNVAQLVKRMSELGNPFMMRIDKDGYTAPQGEESARPYWVVPKKVDVVEQAATPDKTKLELELRAATAQR